MTEKQLLWQREYRNKRKLNPEYRKIINLKDKEWRLKTGRTKKLQKEMSLMKNKEHLRMRAKCSKAVSKYYGKLSVKTLQLVYEDNIKKYGTLTCYLCSKPIIFNEDSLDHIIPASKGGTNDYNNLGITHLKCNISKNKKTLEEFRIAQMKSLTTPIEGDN